jgi:hypothetical protein
MKVRTLALAAALALGGAAFAAPNDSAKAPASPDPTNTVKLKHTATTHAVRHHARVAKREAMRERSASLQTDLNSSSREARMDEALRSFRSRQG